MAKQEDRRIKRTKKVLKEVLIELLQDKKLQKISVKEICDRSDINRSTFYLHYNNVFDLWNSIEDEIISSMNKILYNFHARTILTQPLPLLIDVTAYLEKESILTRKLFQCRESVVLMDKLKTCFIDYFLKNSTEIIQQKNFNELNLYISFVISGSVSLFYKWFLGELEVSLNELAYAIEKLITGGVEGYLGDYIR